MSNFPSFLKLSLKDLELRSDTNRSGYYNILMENEPVIFQGLPIKIMSIKKNGFMTSMVDIQHKQFKMFEKFLNIKLRTMIAKIIVTYNDLFDETYKISDIMNATREILSSDGILMLITYKNQYGTLSTTRMKKNNITSTIKDSSRLIGNIYDVDILLDYVRIGSTITIILTPINLRIEEEIEEEIEEVDIEEKKDVDFDISSENSSSDDNYSDYSDY